MAHFPRRKTEFPTLIPRIFMVVWGEEAWGFQPPKPRPPQQIPALGFSLRLALRDLGPRTSPRSTLASPRAKGR